MSVEEAKNGGSLALARSPVATITPGVAPSFTICTLNIAYNLVAVSSREGNNASGNTRCWMAPTSIIQLATITRTSIQSEKRCKATEGSRERTSFSTLAMCSL